jgi:8'-apo-carotenoid 13,14-cleaving dioxygenase
MASNALMSVVEKSVMKVAAFNKKRMTPPAQPNPYLSGFHAPVPAEVEEIELKVTGTIPECLTGSYLRIGPNPITPRNHASYHWFTGDGMVHGVRIEAGKPKWYRNRWIRSTEVSAALGEPPKPGPRNGTFETVNTNIIGHADQIWALVEASANPVRLDANLDTIAHDPFGGSLKGTFTAHPHLDPETGELHAICYSGPDQNRIFHVVVDASGTVIRREAIPVKDGPMIHDHQKLCDYPRSARHFLKDALFEGL